MEKEAINQKKLKARKIKVDLILPDILPCHLWGESVSFKM